MFVIFYIVFQFNFVSLNVVLSVLLFMGSEAILIGFQVLISCPLEQNIIRHFLKNVVDIGPPTRRKTGVGGKQGHVPYKGFPEHPLL